MTEFYNELKIRKNKGILKPISELNGDVIYNLLIILWGKEGIPDSGIADLYDVSKDTISKLRKKYDIKLQYCPLYSCLYDIDYMEVLKCV